LVFFEGVRGNGDFSAGLATGGMHFDDGSFDLAVVEVDPGMLE
jgi:hypothetical protein